MISMDRQTYQQTDTQTLRKKHKWSRMNGLLTDRQTNRQKHIHTDRHTHISGKCVQGVMGMGLRAL